MQRRIDLLEKHFNTTVSGQPGGYHIQVGDELPQQACLTLKNNFNARILLGESQADLQMVVKGETAFIRAFDRTFTLNVVDPVEQASQEAGGGKDTASAPMPGMVVKVHTAEGETVVKGQALITIESMKILTVIIAPRDGEVENVNFEPGSSFDKNAALVVLKHMEDR